MEANTETNVRLYSYKSLRHYGGREIKVTPHVVKAKFIEQQKDMTYLVELLEPCMLFKAGYKISVITKDFNVQKA